MTDLLEFELTIDEAINQLVDFLPCPDCDTTLDIEHHNPTFQFDCPGCGYTEQYNPDDLDLSFSL